MPIRFNADMREALSKGGFLKEMSLKIGTPQYVGPVLKWVHAELSREFTEYMATISAGSPERFHHVYEWGEVGDPEGQLWRDVLLGGGASRLATFEWLPSRKVVPVVQPEAVGRVQAIHVFTWKAPVMEYETDITIEPKRGGWLAFFTGPQTPADKWPLKFTKGPITVRYPGGEQTHGSFTEEYVAWWSGGGADRIFKTRLRGLLETDLARMPLRTVGEQFRTGARSVTKELTIETLADAEMAERIGAAAARKWLDKRNRDYISGAIAREAIINGGI